MPTVFAVSESKIVEEQIDGEVILINLDHGSYYSLTGTASLLWELLKGRTHDGVGQKVEAQFGAQARELAEVFIAELEAEGLIERSEADAIADDSLTIFLDEHKEFSTPVLEKYTDMEELLLLDPIHEVSQDGWPLVANQGESKETSSATAIRVNDTAASGK